MIGELRTQVAIERAEVLEPLVRRLQDFSRRLALREPIPSQYLREGLDLWQAYVERLHDEHIRELATVGVGGPRPERGDATLVEIEQDPSRAEARIGEVRSMLASYAEGYRVFGDLMSPAIRGNTLAELAWEELEERFLGTWTPPTLSVIAREKLRSALAATRRTTEQLRRQVEDFLQRTAQFGPPGSEPIEARPAPEPSQAAA